jgi:hypothetical protein
VLLTRNKAALLTLKKPRQQSGQEHLGRIYKCIKKLRRDGNRMKILWCPVTEENDLLALAKGRAKEATGQDASPQAQVPRVRSTTLNNARSKLRTKKCLPEKVGNHSKRVDAALPGKHTKEIYDRLSWKEASILAQLRTGMARLNSYLFRIAAASTDQCTCGQAAETVEHFLFRCTKWTSYRTEMLQFENLHVY